KADASDAPFTSKRRNADPAGSAKAGERLESLEDSVVEAQAICWLRVALPGQIDARNEDVFHSETCANAKDLPEAGYQETGKNQEQRGKTHFEAHKTFPK